VRIVSDVSTLKALASVIRRRILSFLEENGQATSADVARALGESSGTTSYHLRLLARHGLVREVESASRRERWWCKVPLDLRFPPVDENVPPAERDAHLDLHRQRLTEDLAQLSGLLHKDDPADLAWTRMSRSSVRVSRAQLDELGAEFQALVARYAALAGDGQADGASEATALVQLRLYAFLDLCVRYRIVQFMARGEVRENAILSAVITLLGEMGYEGMTMDAVAALAHASKATIYKRWPGKAQLVRAAVDGYVAGRLATNADTGSLRGDLTAVLEALAGHLTAEFLAMMSGLVHATRTDPELAAALWPRLGVGYGTALPIVSRAVGRGELPAGAEEELAGLAHEVLEAHVLRQVFAGGAFTPEFARHVVDDLVMPVLTAYQQGEGNVAGITGRADV